MRADYHSSKFRGVIPFSGGIDSTAGLYKTLKSFPEDKFLVFRIQLINGTSGHRNIREGMAAEKILFYLEENGIQNFAFRELSLDYSSLGMMPPIWDSEAVNFAAALVIQAHPEIREFIEGAIADDYLQEGFEERLQKISKILYTHTEKTKDQLSIEFPLKEMSKYEVIQSIPPELLKLTWSCRYPEIGPPYTFVRCHKCPQCKVIDPIVEEHPELIEYLGA